MYLGTLQNPIENEAIDLDLQGHFGLLKLGSNPGRLTLTFKVIFLSNVYNDIPQERINQSTSYENHFDRWVTEKNLDVKNEDH